VRFGDDDGLGVAYTVRAGTSVSRGIRLPGMPAARFARVWRFWSGVNAALVFGVLLGDRDLGWQHAWLGEPIWLLAEQVTVVLLAVAECWLVGAVRAVRRRAPLLRRRYAGRYVPGGTWPSWR